MNDSWLVHVCYAISNKEHSISKNSVDSYFSKDPNEKSCEVVTHMVVTICVSHLSLPKIYLHYEVSGIFPDLDLAAMAITSVVTNETAILER